MRRNAGGASPFLLLLLAFGSFIVTYNLCILVLHKSGGSAAGDLNDQNISRPDWLSGGGGRKFHVALTATDAPDSKWQCRIMYKKMKDMLESDMGGFTRVLHSGNSDNLMDEILTFIVDIENGGEEQELLPWKDLQLLQHLLGNMEGNTL